MKKIFKLLLFLSMCSLAFISCSDDDNDDDDKNEVIIPVAPKKVVENEIILGNQYTTNKPGCFLNVKTQAINTDPTADFDLAFAYYTGSVIKSLYLFAGPTSSALQNEMNKSDVDVSYQCKNKTVFYRLPENFTFSKFDTLKTVVGLNAILAKSKKIYNADNSTDCIYSDEFGWSSGTLYGFQLSTGKYGIFKIDAMPNEYYKGIAATCRLTIKYEGN